MREVAPGDLIFSFMDTRILAIGIAQSYSWECPKPQEFGNAGQNWENVFPIDDIDSTFGPMLPLCKELRTDAGPIDAVFVNNRGRLTIVEFKLWKNPQARREVVAQTLDYVSALAGCRALRYAQ